MEKKDKLISATEQKKSLIMIIIFIFLQFAIEIVIHFNLFLFIPWQKQVCIYESLLPPEYNNNKKVPFLLTSTF